MNDDLLNQILAELRELKAAKATVASTQLGFGYPPRARYVYANRQYADCLWYFWNGEKKSHEPIEAHALTGYIEKLEIEKKEFRGKVEEKINLTVRADQKYIIQAGVDTMFGKGLLHTLAKLPPEAYKQPITISVEAGTTDEVLFCRIYNPQNGNSIYTPFPEQADWGAIIQRACSKINKPN